MGLGRNLTYAESQQVLYEMGVRQEELAKPIWQRKRYYDPWLIHKKSEAARKWKWELHELKAQKQAEEATKAAEIAKDQAEAAEIAWLERLLEKLASDLA